MSARGDTNGTASQAAFEQRMHRAQLWALGCLAIGLLVGSGIYAYRQGTIPRGDMLIAAAGEGAPPARVAQPSPAPAQRIAVHVGGAVVKPGVYELPAGSRVQDALKLAGGVSKIGDRDAVNPAALLADADQVLVPERPPAAPLQAAPTASGTSTPAQRVTTPAASGKLRHPGEGFVNINSATESELQRLPGVGPATAARIIEHRKGVRRFESVEQLMDVSGIGEKRLAAMKPFVRLR